MIEDSLYPVEPERPLTAYATEVSRYFQLLESTVCTDHHRLPFIIQYATDRNNAEEKFIELDPLAVDLLRLAASAAAKGLVGEAKSYLLDAKSCIYRHLEDKGNLYIVPNAGLSTALDHR